MGCPKLDNQQIYIDKLTEILKRNEIQGITVVTMVSAIQMGGERLYNKALRGETVEREPRRVCIKELELTNFEAGAHPIAQFRVVCSKGTYIRSLCQDIGNAMDCGGMLSSLTRSRVGNFLLEDSITLEDLEKKGPSLLMPMVNAVSHLKQFHADPGDG